MRKHALLTPWTSLLTATALAGEPAAPPPVATLIGATSLPGTALDQSGLKGEVMPGIPSARLGSLGSGLETIDAFAGGAHLLAVSDRGPADGAAPFDCRFHRLTLTVDASKSPAVGIACDATELLKRPDGKPFIGLSRELGTTPTLGGGSIHNRLDPEAIRRLPSGHLLVSEEYGPAVVEFDDHGAFVRAWPIPDRFLCNHAGKDEGAELPPHNATGRQPNKGFEGLALTPKGVAWALLQQPLIHDGALNDKGKRAGVNVRLLCLGRAPGETPREFIYRLETPKLGLCELLALDEHRFLTIERDGSERRFRRVYLIDTEGATDIAAMKSLPADTLPDGVKPVSKRAILDLADPSIGLRDMPEKIEGLCLGPTLPDGRRTLVVASDNDMKADEPTWFWVFALPADLLPAAKKTPGADASTTKPSKSLTR